jgi:hypothetical protein
MEKGSTNEQGFNRQLASRLRPGASLEDARAVWGSRWEAPNRKNLGYVGLNDKVGFTARIDRSNRVGEVSFQNNFPPKYSIEGLHLGIPQAAAFAARPGLAPDPNDRTDVDRYGESLTDGCRLYAIFRKGILVCIAIERPGSSYPVGTEFVPAPPGKYPTPEAQAGAPFEDGNLKLAVLDWLVPRRIDLGTAEELAMHVRGKYVDVNEEGYELIPDVYDYLTRYPLTQPDLEAIESLGLCGDADIYFYPFPAWDGEGDDFEARSLAGIERCVNLRELHLRQNAELDLAPLRSLRNLSRLNLEWRLFRNCRVLLELPGLREFRFSGPGVLDDPRVPELLRSRGVTVSES